MYLADILTLKRIAAGVPGGSRKRVLEKLSGLLAGDDAALGRAIFEALNERERMGSTALGHGIAIPHARVAGIEELRAALLRLQKPIPFDAPDQQPVDLLIGLAVPLNCAELHLRVLREIATHLGTEQVRAQLRAATSDAELHAAIKQWQTADMR